LAESAQPEAPPAAPLSQEEPSPVVPLSQQEPSPAVPPSQEESPVAPLSQWLQLMLAEIARKREDLERAHAEAARRAAGE
jgi:hypothetical protein